MSKLMTGLLLTVGIASMAVPAVVGLAGTAEPGPEDAVLVVTWPWAEDPATVVERAGGQDIGPVSAPMAVLASGATVAAYRAAGAIAVLPASALALFCESPS
ncbi:hypothetical protein [Tabrizicola sp. M-4]|uniref:hypothetical protein n=1 Tax=Tabrizicola sp. M-4 TaxID=3055847 RepID=UPI003DA7B050